MKRSVLPRLNAKNVKAALGVASRPEKPARINFLMSPAEKLEIQKTAKAFNLTVTKYLLQMHRLTRSMLDSRKATRRRSGR